MKSWLGRGKKVQVGVTVCCLSAFLLFGYEQGVFGPIIENPNWLDQFGHPSDSHLGIIVSCYNLGCLVGCILNFLIGEKLGRRHTIWFAMAWVILGTSLQTSAFQLPHLIIGRIITGIGTGLKSSTVPTYQSEICTAASRGKLVSAEVLFVGVGITCAYWLNYGMSYVDGSILMAICVVILVFALPESPRWLFNHGREAEAVEVLCIIHDKPADDDFIVSERRVILQALAVEAEIPRTPTSALRRDRVRTGYRVFLAWLTQLMNQIVGINLIVYYIPTVLRTNVGLSPHLSSVLGGCINMMFMVGSFLPTFYLDRMGRRKTMISGCAGLGFCMLMVSALLSQADGGATARGTNFASASVAFFFIYMLIYGATVNCVPWVYVPELLPLNARTQGTAIGVSSNWLWNFTIAMITPIIINRLQWKAYFIFFSTCTIFVPIVYFLYPETSNLRLEEVDLIFTDGRNPVVVGRELVNMKKAGFEPEISDAVAGEKDTKMVATAEESENVPHRP
ncbi:general substrate transporter [Xylariaceae sp. FL0804]|nr:general substrate transporter [Xylariaceae sp. FL0804]